MNLRLKTLWEALLRKLKGFSDPESQFDSIYDAYEEGDFKTVLSETERIILQDKSFLKVFRRKLAKTMFFNSAEEYNNYISRHPGQSFVGWEYPIAPEAHFHRALVFQKSGRLKSSQRELEESLQEYPTSSKYLVELAYVLLNMKHYEQAARAFESAIEHDLTGDASYSVRALTGLGLCYLEQAEFREARRCFAEARKLSLDNREILHHLHLLAELECDPRQRAEFFLSVGSHAQAVDAFSEALNQNPADFDMHMGIAFAYKELSQFEPAEKHLKKAFPLNPNSPQVNFALGWTYLMLDQPEKAEAEILKAIRKNPYDGGFHVGLAYVYLDQAKSGDKVTDDRLLSAAHRAIELDPHYPEPHMILTEYYLALGDLEKARKAVRAALRVAPNNQAVHILAAEVFLESGQKKRTAFHLNEAADFGTDTEEMKFLRDRLKGDLP